MKVMVIVKATKAYENGAMPSRELLSEMGKYNEALVKAGIMLDGDGLRPSSHGKRVRFDGNNRTVIDGPFAETKEQIAGFDLLECTDLDDAITVAAGHPVADGGSLELRPLWA